MKTGIREPFNAISHFVAALVALAGIIFLLLRIDHDGVQKIALVVYGFSLVSLFISSALYHSVPADPRWQTLLRKIDHSAIYLLIAGTYTPICIFFFQGFYQWGVLSIIWGMALIGMIVKLFIINAPRWVTAGIYLVMGWFSIFTASEMLRSMPADAITWLLAGGLFYTLGAVIYITKKLDFFPGKFGFHEIWHIFVILGAFSHFITIAGFIYW